MNSSAIDGSTMIKQKDWIITPVGYNLDDHTNVSILFTWRSDFTNFRKTDLIISHPNVTFYDFYQAWTDPIASDKAAYLSKLLG